MKKFLFSIVCMLIFSHAQAYAERYATYHFQKVGEAGMRLDGTGYADMRWYNQKSGYIAINTNKTLWIKYDGVYAIDEYTIKNVETIPYGIRLNLEQIEIFDDPELVGNDPFQLSLKSTMEITKDRNGTYYVKFEGGWKYIIFSCAWATFNNK